MSDDAYKAVDELAIAAYNGKCLWLDPKTLEDWDKFDGYVACNERHIKHGPTTAPCDCRVLVTKLVSIPKDQLTEQAVKDVIREEDGTTSMLHCQRMTDLLLPLLLPKSSN